MILTNRTRSILQRKRIRSRRTPYQPYKAMETDPCAIYAGLVPPGTQTIYPANVHSVRNVVMLSYTTNDPDTYSIRRNDIVNPRGQE
jgi:hypothetical protein